MICTEHVAGDDGEGERDEDGRERESKVDKSNEGVRIES